MNKVSRTITGVALSVLGAFIAIASYLDKSPDWLWGLGVGLVFLVLGVYIFFNTQEDDIEEIIHKEESQ
jgi:uncharacterized membrane protein HdeD (DUF308 family)